MPSALVASSTAVQGWFVGLMSGTSLDGVDAVLLHIGPGGAADAGGLIALGAGLGIGIAALGVGLGQGRASAAAMESIGRNPNSADRIFVPMIIE